MLDREALVEMVAAAIHATGVPHRQWRAQLPRQQERWRRIARAALAVIEPVVRDACAETTLFVYEIRMGYDTEKYPIAEDIAAAIRGGSNAGS